MRIGLGLLSFLAACGPALELASAEDSGGAPAEREARSLAMDKETIGADPELVITLADGADEWGSRRVPWALSGDAVDDMTALCIGRSPRGCIRWGQAVPQGTWISNPVPGTQRVYAWWRDASPGVKGPVSAEIYVDAVAPETGTGAVEPVPGGLDVSWTGFSDAGRGIESYRVYVGEGVSVARCVDEGEPDWEGTETETTLTGLAAEQHTVRICAVDGLGNVSLGLLVRGTPDPETVAPTVADFSVSEDAPVVSSRSVTLHGTITDDSALEFCASETASSAAGCSVWRDWTDGVGWDMGTDEGQHTVSAWFRDSYGNLSTTASDTVVLDRSRPLDGTVTGETGSGELSLEWSGFTDAFSEVVEYIVVSEETWAPDDCDSGTLRYRGSTTSTTITGLPGDEYVGVRVCAVDAMGHVSRGVNQRYRVLAESDPPAVASFTLNGGVAEAYQRRVSTEISATDASGIARMCFSTDESLCYAWEAFSATDDVLLPNTEGTYTVYLWLEDTQGIRSATPASASVTWRGPLDGDGDGVEEDADCDDEDASRYPGAAELCDGVDNDCDGDIDENAVDATTWYTDADGDGHGDASETVAACEAPEGAVASATDCDDADAAKNPDAVEGCGATEDMNCDGVVVPADCDSCLAILEEGSSTGDGYYTIDPDGPGGDDPVQTWCDMSTDGGGWTLVQRTVWDWADSQALLTAFTGWHDGTIGQSTDGEVFRLAGKHWVTLNAEQDHMVVHVPRDRDTGESCDELVYLAAEGALDISGTSVSLTGMQSTVNFNRGDYLSTTDSGPQSSCVNTYGAVPWFYSGCCYTCPTFQGSYWNDEPHPMAYYLDITADLYGNTTAEVCGSGAAVESRSFEGVNEMEYFLR